MKVEVLAPPVNSFVVGRDLVGFGRVGDDPEVWEDLIADAGAFTSSRGQVASGLSGLDVGSLNVPLKDVDPQLDSRLRSGRRVRVVDDSSRVVVRENLVSNPSLSVSAAGWSTWAGSGAREAAASCFGWFGYRFTVGTPSLVPAVQVMSGASAPVVAGRSYGFAVSVRRVSGASVKVRPRVQFLTAGGGGLLEVVGDLVELSGTGWTVLRVDAVAPAGASLVGGTTGIVFDPSVSSGAVADFDGVIVEESAPVRGSYFFDGDSPGAAWAGSPGLSRSTLTLTASDRVLWFGRLADVTSVDGRDFLTTSLVAADTVDELSNARAAGVGVPGGTVDLEGRVSELAVSSTVPLLVVGAAGVESDPLTWSAFDSFDDPLAVVQISGGVIATQSSWWFDSPAFGVTQALLKVLIPAAGLPEGASHAVEFDLASSLSGAPAFMATASAKFTSGPLMTAVEVTTAGRVKLPAVPKEAGDLEVTVELSPLQSGSGSGTSIISISHLVVIPKPGRVLQASSTEDSIAGHLTVACDSTGAAWRPTLQGTIEILEGPTTLTPTARFSDNAADKTADAYYTQLDSGFAATGELINDLTVTNQGPSAETTSQHVNDWSIASYGRRAASLSTCLATPELRDSRADSILADHEEPSWSVRSVRVNYDDLFDVPDLYDLVEVVRRGTVHRCEVVGVSHEVEPDRDRPTSRKHFVTFQLRKAVL